MVMLKKGVCWYFKWIFYLGFDHGRKFHLLLVFNKPSFVREKKLHCQAEWSDITGILREINSAIAALNAM